MLKIIKTKITKPTFVLQKNHTRSGFKTAAKILTINNIEELSKYMLPLKDEQIMFRIRWSIVKTV